MKTTVAFPGLGIGEFAMDRVAFSIFGKDIYWYGVIIMLGMVAAFTHAYIRCKQEKISTDDLLDVGIWTVLCGVLGARLYYVLTTLGEDEYHSIVDVIAIWNGGLAIYGGIIAGAVTIAVVTRIKKMNTVQLMDTVAPGVMIAQAMGRWANFVNGEAFGREIAEGSLLYPFRMGLISDFTGSEMLYYHPTFLYESMWNLVGFVLITIFYRKKRFHGEITLCYLTWYGFGRMFIEGLRTDSLYAGPFRISQLVGFVCFVAGLALIITGYVLAAKRKLPAFMQVTWGASAEGVSDEAAEEKTETEEINENNAPATDTAEGEMEDYNGKAD